MSRRTARVAEQKPVDTMSDIKAEREKAAFDAAVWFAKNVYTPIWVTTDQSTKQSTTYSRYTKEQVLEYLQTPSTNERNIRNASIYMYDASSHYRRLIAYYAGLLKWDYVLTPLDFDKKRVKPDGFRKQYLKVQSQLDMMNIPHELYKASIVTLRDGVFYGAVWKNNNSYFIQRINPDYCSLTSLEDGTWKYSVDMSKIQENKIALYPPEFKKMWNRYNEGGNKWQEVPTEICFCLKADETTTNYSIPPWASTLPMLYDIETYKALQETATKISNYKVLGMEIPLNDDGTPKVDWTEAEKYYQQLCKVLPPYVGAFTAPMKTTAYEFKKDSGTQDVDTVGRAEEQYWFNTGTSALLHGSTSNNSAGALKLSIRSDEEIMFGFMLQAERLINRIVSSIAGTIKFKVKFLPNTIYNQDDQIKLYKEAGTLGIPGAKTAYTVSIGVSQSSIPGMEYMEKEIYEMEDWEPLVSGYTGGGSDEVGRTPSNDTDLSESGEATRDNDSNENR